jgi:hypothetical protein
LQKHIFVNENLRITIKDFRIKKWEELLNLEKDEK